MRWQAGAGWQAGGGAGEEHAPGIAAHGSLRNTERMMASGDQSAREQSALRLSIWISLAFAVVAVVWGLAAGSQVILLDAIFTPLGVLLSWGSLVVSRIVAKGPTRRFPFGRDALVPLFVIVQAIVLFGALAYAIFEAVRVIIEGGSDVSGLSLLLYGILSAITCVVVWRILVIRGKGLPLIEAEAASWLSSLTSSAVIVVGGLLALILVHTPADWVTPYLDSVLVLAGSVGLLVMPVSLVRGAVRDLQLASPGSELTAQIEALVEDVRIAEQLPAPKILRIGKLGSSLTVELGFVLDPGTGDVACEDRVRRALIAGLDELGVSPWVVVEFTYDAALLD